MVRLSRLALTSSVLNFQFIHPFITRYHLKGKELKQSFTSIEQKLQAEQDAMRMEFILQQEKLEAERKIIEATGTKDAQKILSEGLTPEILQIRSIEAFIELAKSANSKVIITDGKLPYLINE
jgi:regulator of protease activity HflC (stomatin/prohibitin superfamily)